MLPLLLTNKLAGAPLCSYHALHCPPALSTKHDVTQDKPAIRWKWLQSPTTITGSAVPAAAALTAAEHSFCIRVREPGGGCTHDQSCHLKPLHLLLNSGLLPPWAKPRATSVTPLSNLLQCAEHAHTIPQGIKPEPPPTKQTCRPQHNVEITSLQLPELLPHAAVANIKTSIAAVASLTELPLPLSNSCAPTATAPAVTSSWHRCGSI